jgi:NADPH:quinone reductase-like Zn-dependent oxidoreductase
VHPALLDACLQAIGAAQDKADGRAMLPVSVAAYRLARAADRWPDGLVYVLVELRERGGDAEADVRIVDAEGEMLAELAGLAIRRVGAAPLWRVRWSAAAESVEGAPELRRGAGDWAVALREVLPEWVDAGSVLLTGSADAITAGLLLVVKRERERAGSVRRICVVTRGGQAAAAGDRVDAGQAAVWGVARTLRVEYPAMVVLLADLPGGDDEIETEVTCLAAWVRGAEAASAEAVVRRGRVLLPRLERAGVVDGQPKVLEIGTPGLLETLRETAYVPPEPGPGEVQIAVRAHGLNFRDVLTAMGTYAGVAAPMGAECAGVVVKAGAGASLVVGDAVMAFAPASLRSLVTLPEAFVARKPAAMTWAEAATVPVAFLTAQYGFAELARLEPGQSVLVHSAAGGLGQAAVQLARRMGARVIATAGSEAKRVWLRGHGIAEVFDSRSESFVEDVLRVTDGRGVDVVLNALPLVEAGLRTLARGGAFLEVGKRDIWSAERVAEARPDVRYWAFDLGEVAMREPEQIRAMLGGIVSAMERGELRPLVRECYAMTEAEAAFRKMASGRHVGKLVLMREDAVMPREAWIAGLREGGALITGGTGALGVTAARWLLKKGLRTVTLVSRGGGSDEDVALVEEFGGRVVVERADVADRDLMRGVMERARTQAPLRLVVHAAGELRDGVLAEATEESLAAAMRTKVDGAKVLAELTENDALLATVYYSSIVGVLGAAGQAGYAAANAYLDGMAEERNGRGLRTLSVDWGAWAEGGMAARLSASAAARAERQGFRPMAAGAALDAMEAALLDGRACVAIADMDWGRFAGGFGDGLGESSAGAFFTGFLPGRKGMTGGVGTAGEEAGKTVAFAAILAGPKAERLERMEKYVRDAARKVLGLSAGRPMPAEMALQEMGLDSLMALELRNVLAQAAGRPLSATLLFDYPTIRGLAGFLMGLLAEDGNKTLEVSAAPVAGGADSEVAVEEMSDAEAEALLLAELDELERKGAR